VPEEEGVRIAIVGAGISGLATAHLLHPRHEVTVFEAGPRPGGHANTVRVDTEDATHHVDTGFIVFNDRNYPNFEKLLAALRVPSQPSDMSFGVSDGDDFEYTGASPNGLFAKRTHLVTPWFHRMIADLVRFNTNARRLLARDDDPSLGHWLDDGGYSRAFIERLIVPQASAVWSADPRQMWTFPARFLVEFFANHGMLGFAKRPQWRTVVGGSRTYVDAVTRPFGERLRVNSPIAAIARDEDGVTVTPRGQAPERFDEVVLATHSDQALRMLTDASDREHEILSAIPYQPNEAVLHTDRRLLPRRRRAWASWNYHLLPEPTGMTTVTYHMNRLQALSADREFCVTLNRTDAIDPAKVLRTISYAHPVFTPAGARAQARHHEISGHNRTHYAGAYWHWGFHEDGVVSAARVAERFGARL
jgi:predicted NAD/FAD-binding protein